MGLLVVLIIMGATAILMCATYEYRIGESLLKNLFHDIFTKG